MKAQSHRKRCRSVSHCSRLRGAAAVAFCLLTQAGQAQAFCQARTCDRRASDCATDDHNCVTEGMPVRWEAAELPIWVDPEGSVRQGIDAATTAAILGRVVARWMAAPCPNGGMPSVSLYLADEPPAPEAELSNVVTYVDSGWRYDASIGALTDLTLNLDTGEILSTTLEINSDLHEFAVGAGPGQIDLEAVLTHEVGHLLGLDHSDVAGATMQPEADGFGSQELRSLEPDDVAGICAVYPPGAEPANDMDVEGNPKGRAACSASLGPRRVDGRSAWILCAAMAVLCLRRRRDRT